MVKPPPACSKLRGWRIGQQLSQEQAGEKVGVARRTWHQWEAGSTIPGVALMIELFQLTGGLVQPNDFYALPGLEPKDRAA